jgi:hypothetical protein
LVVSPFKKLRKKSIIAKQAGSRLLQLRPRIAFALEKRPLYVYFSVLSARLALIFVSGTAHSELQPS